MRFSFSSFVSVFCFFVASHGFANNIQVSNIRLLGQNQAQNYTFIEFDLSWENSWRVSAGPSNWDAAWVFAKYLRGGVWNHVNLSSTPGDHVVPVGVEVSLPNGGAGAMIHRSVDGSGHVDWEDIQLRWDYGLIPDDSVVDLQVFAVEMVYVPEGAYYLGSGVGGSGFYEFKTFPFQTPYQVTNAGPIPVGDTLGHLYYGDSANTGGGDLLGPIPATFPNGFPAFYCMKYEITQDQWVTFFNSLPETAKPARDVTASGKKGSDIDLARNAVSWPDSGNATTTLPDVPLVFAEIADIAAYLDWAGMRFMTELEFEKACRGPVFPVPDEYAWGTPHVTDVRYVTGEAGTPNEVVTNPGVLIGNANYVQTRDELGPLRSGIFAASSVNHTRSETGGTYYGIMEMSGNVQELMISVGNPEGRGFTGAMGDGELTTTGEANVVSWPDPSTGIGYVYRGGAHSIIFNPISYRSAISTVFVGGNENHGGRGVVSAP